MTIAQMLFKKAGLYAKDQGEWFLAFVLNPWLAIGLGLSIGAMACWVLTLRSMTLSLAYSWTALTYVFIPLGSVFLFGEVITLKYVFGMVLIISGILAVTLGKDTA